MNLLFRLLCMLFSAPFRKRQEFTETMTVQFRVWPTDLDINFHMTNSKYLSLMDLGRLDLMLGSGMMREVLKQRWGPVLSVASIRFRRQLNPFQKFSLHTRLIGWDEKWFYMEQRFETDRGVAATALTKGLFRGANGNVPTASLLALVGYTGDTVNKTELTRAMDALEQQLKVKK